MTNRIEVKPIRTGYGYDEYYWVIDEVPITTYLDDWKARRVADSMGLLPAWSGGLNEAAENDFVWEMVDSQDEQNVPILVCEDDCDFSCLVIVAHVRKRERTVCWDRIGVVDWASFDNRQYERSGILCLEAYTEEDWRKYGDHIALERFGSEAYWDWVRENGYEEGIRRLRNYLKPYMQEVRNIEWIGCPDWKFETGNYAVAVERYRELAGRDGQSFEE